MILTTHATKVQFKFRTGYDDEGKEIYANKSFDRVKRNFTDYDKLVELGSLVAGVIGADTDMYSFKTYLVRTDEISE